MEFSDDRSYSGEVMRYYHFQCVLDNFQKIGINLTIEMEGFDDLEDDDKKECIEKICEITGEKVEKKKRGNKSIKYASIEIFLMNLYRKERRRNSLSNRISQQIKRPIK